MKTTGGGRTESIGAVKDGEYNEMGNLNSAKNQREGKSQKGQL